MPPSGAPSTPADGAKDVDIAALESDQRNEVDAEVRVTLYFIERRLLRNGLMHRYMADVEPTRRTAGALGICGFWYIDCLARCGQVDRARHAYRQMIGTANELGLFAEESDPETFEALGNFPQALTHIGVIFASQTIRHHEQNNERKDPAGAVAWR